MRFLWILAWTLSAAATPQPATAQGQPIGALATIRRATIVVTTCPATLDSDKFCRAIEIRHGSKADKLGAGYTRVSLLWTGNGQVNGPDAVVRGDYGGSGGEADLFAISLSHGPAIQKLSGGRIDSVRIDSAHTDTPHIASAHIARRVTPLRFDLPFGIEYVNGAPNAGETIIPIPMRWTNGNFAVDMKALTARNFPAGDLRFREIAIGHELNRWTNDSYPAKRLFPPVANGGTPVTTQALADLMLTGHADRARMMLHKSWPRSPGRGDIAMPGEDAFWNALCNKVVHNEHWRRFGLNRLPHADLIEASARTSQ